MEEGLCFLRNTQADVLTLALRATSVKEKQAAPNGATQWHFNDFLYKRAAPTVLSQML
jgi:hypothetical protein